MKIIDAHMHTVLELKSKEWAKRNNIDFSENGLRKECKENDIEQVISIAGDTKLPTPMGLEKIRQQQIIDPNIHAVIGVNPEIKISKAIMKEIRSDIISGKIKGIKIFLGYFHRYANDKVYHPFYRLAAEYGCPVIFHTGDTFSETAKLKYSHPLTIDEVAVDFPNTTFIIAHMGEPWIADAAEVIYKNPNVYGDLSAFVIGKVDKNSVKETAPKIRFILNYIKDHKKLLYGSDWPLVRMKDYIWLMKKIIPKRFHKDIFYNNAKKVFRL